MWRTVMIPWLMLSAAAAAAAAAGLNKTELTVLVYAAAPDGSRAGGAALAAVAALALQRVGMRARAVPPPPACLAPPAALDSCTHSMLRGLCVGDAHAALLAVRAAPALDALQMRDAGLEEFGDAAPPWRRACLATRPPARSLLDLADPALAAVYRLGSLDRILVSKHNVTQNCTFTPEWCVDTNATCATILTSDETEIDVLGKVVREYHLHAKVLALGPALAEAAAALAAPALVCDRAPELSPLASLRAAPLGAPPCRGRDCPFEPLRLVKVANVRELARYPRALRLLAQLALRPDDLVELTRGAHTAGADEAARTYNAKHPQMKLFSEVRVAVMLPLITSRQVYDTDSFRRAAVLVESETRNTPLPQSTRFKVEIVNDGCSAPQAYKYLVNALGTSEYGALSAVAGPACGAAFGDVARQAPAHIMPVLAYTPQAPPPPPADALALLMAGDARRLTDLWAALLSALNWRRLAVLGEVGTRVSLDISRLNSGEVLNYELPDDGKVHEEIITQWANRAAADNYKIMYVFVEDARQARAALCAGHAAGLSPRAGGVWLLAGALPRDWARPPADAPPPCAAAQLAEMAEGHLRAAPAWEADWSAAARAEWAARCPDCEPRSALIYDALSLWLGGLTRLLKAEPIALDNMHNRNFVQALIDDVTSCNYTGLTGSFEWNLVDKVHARVIPHVVQQWSNGSYRTVGRWHNGSLALRAGALRWAAADGRVPDDGGARCALQPLAELLRADCRTAFIVLAALLLTALVGALAALALYCRRRAEREYRAHLEALRLRTYGLKPGGLDRWEVPRERVVINRKLGTGAFGTVYGGHALLAEDRGWTAVAVKTLKAGATTEEKLDFLSEAEAMKRFDHKNVVRLLAVVTKTEPVCTVMEFMLYGDLKNYLLARRHLATEAGLGAEAAEEVSPRRLTAMALDAARALSYLAQLRYVHRDVAARNCLVSANRVVKLADFGMTRLVFENDYYRFSRKGMLPVRWMAPESLALGVFSPASDVWSFGVLLYEIVTFGSLPFQGLSNSEVLGRVKAGHTLDLPTGLKPQLEGLIKSCWRQEAKARPMAAEVAAFLADSPRLLAPCLDVPLDALPLDPDPPWRAARDRAEARWVSWAAPASAATDTTYLSADARPPSEADAFLPAPPTP